MLPPILLATLSDDNRSLDHSDSSYDLMATSRARWFNPERLLRIEPMCDSNKA